MNQDFQKKLKQLSNIKNKHRNKEFVVIGGGPSIEHISGDNKLFNNKITIACNFKKSDIQADYHLLHDPLAIMWWKKNNVDLESNLVFSDICKNYNLYNSHKNPDKMKIALNTSHIRDRWLGDVPLVEYLNQISFLARNKDTSFYYVESPFYKFYENFNMKKTKNRISEKWYGSGFLAIDTAIYLGAKKIYLVGFDGGQNHSYENNPSHRHFRMKNRNITHWNQHRERIKQIKKEVSLVLVNSHYSIYNDLIEGVRI
jgi:hypothetical protein